MRKPHRAILRHGAPAPVIVEILITDYVFRDIAFGDGVVFAKVALVTPRIEIVFTGNRLDVGIERIRTGEEALLFGMNGISRTAAGDFALALSDANVSSVACLIDVETVASGPKNGKSQIRSIDLDGLVLGHAANS